MNAPVHGSALPVTGARITLNARRRYGLSIAKRLLNLTTMLTLLIAWEVTGSFILPKMGHYYIALFPPPSQIAVAAWELIKPGTLFIHILASTKRVIFGLGMAAGLAIPSGLLKTWYPPLNNQMDPILEFFRPIPPIAWIPLSILWFGLGDAQGQFIIFLAAFFPILLNTVAGARSIPRNVIRAAMNLGASGFFLFRKVIVPGALPNIIVGIRIGFGIGWMATVAAELVAAPSGLGFLINQARNFLRTDQVMVGMVTIGVVGVVFNRTLLRVERRLLPWYESSQ